MNRPRTIMILTLMLLALCWFSSNAKADTDGKFSIISHNNEMVVTDPSKGSNSYPNWTIFPDNETDYRKVILYITYRCPDSLHCGEWDYIDAVYLSQLGNDRPEFKNIELARMISPYGWRFDSEWEFTWHVDITDYAFLLHDSVEIEFKHTGYENKDDRGWLITLDFEFTEGTPAVEILGMDTLWCGSFRYGDTAQPIEDKLSEQIFSHPSAEMVRLRIHQTGHGMDDFENCAEFCNKDRMVFFDNDLKDRREIWRKCTNNPLYPQAGTWIFDRANWCPGSVVFPDVYDYNITPDSTHTVNIDMEPYVNPNKPTANYSIYSYLFYAMKPWATNDVSLEEIIVPSDQPEYSRFNPACAMPRIVVKNSGSEPVTSMLIEYGNDNRMDQFEWHGEIKSQKSSEIQLPGTFESDGSLSLFTVNLSLPNKLQDEYPDDNSGYSTITNPPLLGTEFILVFRTNKEAFHNSYQIINGEGRIVGGRALGAMQPEQIYRDTLLLEPGCYELYVIDTSGEGLEFWFHPDGGYGYVRLLDMQERLIKNFLSDFGSEIRYSFMVTESETPAYSLDSLPLMTLFPPRNDGQFMLHYFFNEPTDFGINIVSDSTNAIVYENNYTDSKDGMTSIDISDQTDGRYHVNMTIGERTISRRIKIKTGN